MQSVNFYLPQYHPKPLTFDSRFAALTLVLTLGLLVVFGVFQANLLTQRQALNIQKQQELDNIQKEFQVLRASLNRTQPNGLTLDEQIVLKQKELNSFRKILSDINLPNNTDSMPYSHVLSALDQQNSSQVWLTKIQIAPKNLSLYGSSFNSEAIPAYVDNLKQSRPLLRQFDDLAVKRDSENPRIIHFELRNGRLVTDG